MNVPEFAYATAEGQWAVEGHGVDPDIVVENDPKSLLEGHDPQLERGVAELLKALEKSNPKLPDARALSGEAEVGAGQAVLRTFRPAVTMTSKRPLNRRANARSFRQRGVWGFGPKRPGID